MAMALQVEAATKGEVNAEDFLAICLKSRRAASASNTLVDEARP